jgi:hypothetical protein
MKMNFKSYLNEKHQLTHLEHLEDLVFIEGIKGAKKSLEYLKNITADIASHDTQMVVQQKVDGAPSIIAGWSPEDNRFFVGTKSFFNKTPKINYSPEDVDKNHGHSDGLSKKLKEALKYLPKVVKKGQIHQGDFMFSADDLKSEKIDGIPVITFTPNTITYAVPKDTPLYKTISGAKIGVIWHTSYSGNTLDSLNGSFKISNSQINQTKEVYSRTTNTTLDEIGWNAGEEKVIENDIKNLENDLKGFDKKQVDEIVKNNKLSLIIRTYINQKVRDGVNRFNKNEIKGLIDYIKARYQKDIDKLKSEKGKNKKMFEMQEFIDNLRNYASTLYHLFDWSYRVQHIKIFIIDKLQELNSPETPYIRQGDGSYQITDPEGFVLSDTSDSGIKMVNRAVFSKNNFERSSF